MTQTINCLEKDAMHLFQYPLESVADTTIRSALHTLLRLWKYESFGSRTSWTIIRSTGNFYTRKGYFVRRLNWKESVKLSGVIPDYFIYPSSPLTIDDAELSEELANKIIHGLDSISLAGIPHEESLTLDGDQFGLAHQLATLEWHDNGPQQWKDLATWMRKTLATLDKTIKKADFSLDQLQIKRNRNLPLQVPRDTNF